VPVDGRGAAEAGRADRSERRVGPARSVLVQYLLLALTWGASFLFIKVGLEGLSPGQVVLGRLTAGAVALALISAVTRQRLPREAAVWAHLAVVAVLLCVVPFLLFAWAEQHVSSGLASILNATTPLMTTLVALGALPQERPTRTHLAGLLTGFAGVVLVLAPWADTAVTGTPGSVGGGQVGSWAGEVACLAATFSYGLAFVYLRRTLAPRKLPAVPVATVQVGLAAAAMLALTPLLAAQPVHLTGRVVTSVLALGVLGTGLAYVWNTNVVAGWGATDASTVTYLTPLVGVVAGAVVLGEHVTWNQPAGALVVVLGIAISQDRLPALRAFADLPRSRSAAATAEPPAQAPGSTSSADPADSYAI
jgi:drug/metabolite transporter (DMT)-like permease